MKKLFLLFFWSTFLIHLPAQTQKIATEQPQGCKLKIGDKYAGGIVFHIDPDNECHGLVCTEYDQEKDSKWDDAITLCKNLRIGGYSDWRLPSMHELNQMYIYLYEAKLGGIANSYYWSSNEYGKKRACFYAFNDGSQDHASKGYPYYVRAVRSF